MNDLNEQIKTAVKEALLEPVWLDTAEAARLLKVNPRTVQRKCEAGEFGDGQKKLGNRWRISWAAINAHRIGSL